MVIQTTARAAHSESNEQSLDWLRLCLALGIIVEDDAGFDFALIFLSIYFQIDNFLIKTDTVYIYIYIKMNATAKL